MGFYDFWMTRQSATAYRVSSPLLEMTFSRAPTAKLIPSKDTTADGKPFSIFTFSAGSLESGKLEKVEVLLLGRGAQDVGMVASLEALLGQVGKVTTTPRTVQGREITELVVADGSQQLKAHVHKDLARGVVVIATSLGAPGDGDALLASVALRPTGNPASGESLTLETENAADGVVLRDKEKRFSVAFPGPPVLTRTPNAADFVVTSTATWTDEATKATVELSVVEASVPDYLHEMQDATQAPSLILPKRFAEITKETVPAEPFTVDRTPAVLVQTADRRTRMVMFGQPFQHRYYVLRCENHPCWSVINSFAFVNEAP